MFCLFKELFVFVLAHLLFAPFYYITHRPTSLSLFSIFFCLVHKGLKLNLCCKGRSAVVGYAQAGYAVLSLDSTHQPADNRPRHASKWHGIDNARGPFFYQFNAFADTEDSFTLEGGGARRL